MNDSNAIIELLFCSAALFKMLGEEVYLKEIYAYREHPKRAVQSRAKMCLDELGQPGGFVTKGTGGWPR